MSELTDLEICKKIAGVIVYDKTTGVFTWDGYDAKRAVNGNPAGSFQKSSGYTVISFKRKKVRAHRLAWFIEFGKLPAGELDHINGNRSDNRISNLRDVTRKENSRNKCIGSLNSSGVMGVSWCKRDSVWRSQIHNGVKNICTGNFKDKFEAICSRKSAENLFGYHSNHGRLSNA